MKKIISEIIELQKNAEFAYVGSVNEVGIPQIKCMFATKCENMKTHYFSTNTSSKRAGQFLKNPKACVYYCDETNFAVIVLYSSIALLLSGALIAETTLKSQPAAFRTVENAEVLASRPTITSTLGDVSTTE